MKIIKEIQEILQTTDCNFMTNSDSLATIKFKNPTDGSYVKTDENRKASKTSSVDKENDLMVMNEALEELTEDNKRLA